MAFILVWLIIIAAGGIGGTLFCKVFAANGDVSIYGALLGMIVALLSAIFFQLNLMHQDDKK